MSFTSFFPCFRLLSRFNWTKKHFQIASDLQHQQRHLPCIAFLQGIKLDSRCHGGRGARGRTCTTGRVGYGPLLGYQWPPGWHSIFRLGVSELNLTNATVTGRGQHPTYRAFFSKDLWFIYAHIRIGCENLQNNEGQTIPITGVSINWLENPPKAFEP